MVQYSSTSPYYRTDTFSNYLDVMTHRSIPREADDVVYQIQEVYKHRPDMLAHDLYGDASLWWVFAVRNPNTIKDPVYDFFTGQTIYIPKQSTLNEALGL